MGSLPANQGQFAGVLNGEDQNEMDPEQVLQERQLYAFGIEHSQ